MRVLPVFTLLCTVVVAACSQPKSGPRPVPVSKLQKAHQPVYMSDDDTPMTVSKAGMVFAFDPEFPSEFKPACVRAIQTANEAMGKRVLDYSEATIPYSEESDGYSVISYGKMGGVTEVGHAAETRIVYADAQIFEADIDFDIKHFSFTVTDEPGKADMESVCLHEIGHALGLGHSDDKSSMMYPTLTAGHKKHRFSDEDIANLRRAAGDSGVAAK